MRRRDLIKNSALAGAAAIMPNLLDAATSKHQPVATALAAYSRRQAQKQTTDGSVHLVVSIDDLEAFADHEVRCRALPYEGIVADGNLITFTHESTLYRIENVLPQDYASALA